MLNHLTQQARAAMTELITVAKPNPFDIVVVGCSSSEAGGHKIGTDSSEAVAAAIFAGIYPVLQEHDLYLAAQCCEHLNRALIIERAAAEKYHLEPVNVIPQPKSGWLLCYYCVPYIYRSGGGGRSTGGLRIDIGGTLIGMHLKGGRSGAVIYRQKSERLDSLCADSQIYRRMSCRLQRKKNCF